jgi:hypothetical protein
MTTGRPPKPIEQKRRLGNPGKRPLPSPLTVLPAVSDALLGRGSVAEALRSTGAAAWIGETDLPVLRLAQQLADDAERLRAFLDDEFSKDAYLSYIATQRELRACLSLLGLSPTDRSRLGVAEVKARSKLEELMDRRAGRHAS